MLGGKKNKDSKKGLAGLLAGVKQKKKDLAAAQGGPKPGPVKSGPKPQPKPQSTKPKPQSTKSKPKPKPKPKVKKEDAKKQSNWAMDYANSVKDMATSDKGVFNGPGSKSSSGGPGASLSTSAESHDMSADGVEHKFEFQSKGPKGPQTKETKGPKDKKDYKNVKDQFVENTGVEVDFFSESHEVWANQIGNDQAHVNFGHAETSLSSGMEITKDKADIDLISFDAKASAVHAELDLEQEHLGGWAETGMHGEVDLLSAEAGLDVGTTIDWTKGEVSAEAGGEVGAYLASAEGEVDGSLTIPFLGLEIGGHAGGEANIGVGAEASAEGGFTKDKGLYFNTTLGASFGPGAKADVGGSINVADAGLIPALTGQGDLLTEGQAEWLGDAKDKTVEVAGDIKDGAVEFAGDVKDVAGDALDVAGDAVDDVKKGTMNVLGGIGDFLTGDKSPKKAGSKAPKKKKSTKGKG